MSLEDATPEQLVDIVNNGGLSKLANAINDAAKPAASTPVDTNLPPPELPSPSLLPSEPQQLVPTRDQGFDIKDPVELLFLLDDDIREGRVELHGWQVQFMLDFANAGHTKDSPFQAAVQACNGSGKDKYIVAACAVWLCMRYLQSRCVVTNGSGVQLDNQTEVYIRLLCNAANAKIAPNIWKCNYRYYECLATGSPMTLFATDEPNKAEGYHPIIFAAKMAVFASEAKAIPDEIFTGLERCSGFTHRVDVSTPGLPVGYFYDTCTTALDRKDIEDIKTVKSTQVIKYVVTAYECSHITQSEIDRIESKLPGGKNNAVFKSSVLAEFTTTDEMVVVPYTYIWKAANHAPRNGHVVESFNTGGLDLSDGGAETALTVRNGNKHIITIPFRFDNTEDTVAFLNEKFREYELNNPQSHINADCSGMGKPMLDRMKRQGWTNIRYIANNNKASEFRTFVNRGTEMWFHVRRLLELHEISIQQDKLLTKQLATRYYKLTTKNMHQLLSKLEQRSRGYPSPDRADSFVLCFCDYKSVFKEAIPDEQKPFKQVEEVKPVSEFNMQEWAKRGTENPNECLHPSRHLNLSVYRASINRYNAQLKLAQPKEKENSYEPSQTGREENREEVKA